MPAITKTSLNAAADKARQRLSDEMSGTQFAAVATMVCKLFWKYLNEALEDKE